MNQKAELPHSVTEVFLVMQGGGAKGIAHAGGLIAIEEEKLAIKGIAGTSAGSIAAALVAAGYSGRELADPDEKKHIFNRPPFGKEKGQLPYSKPTQMFTWLGWLILYVLRSIPRVWQRILVPSSSLPILVAYWSFIILSTLYALIGILIYAPGVIPSVGRYLSQSAQNSAHVALGVVVFCGIWALWGITSVRNIRKIIDLTLARKLSDRLKKAGITKDKEITFEDMHITGCPPLKIIATNTATESLELFCLERTPRVVVADAVAASICLPIIFKPKTLKFIRHTPVAEVEVRGIFLDGGLVSNLPAWALDEERLLHPGVPTIALSLSPPAPMNRKFWFNALTGTIVNGSSEIHTRTPNQILTISLETKTDLLDFDLPATKVFEEVAEAQKRVTEELSMALRGPTALQEAVKELHRELKHQFQRYKGILFLPQADDRLRVAIAVQRGSSMRTVSMAFAHGYTPEDLDAGMTILIDGSHVGEAWKRNEVIVDEVVNGIATRFALPAKSWSAMTWLLCCPVAYAAEQGRKARPFIITVDSNIKFNRNAVHFEKTFKRFQAFISYTIERYTTETNLAQYAQGANTWL